LLLLVITLGTFDQSGLLGSLGDFFEDLTSLGIGFFLLFGNFTRFLNGLVSLSLFVINGDFFGFFYMALSSLSGLFDEGLALFAPKTNFPD